MDFKAMSQVRSECPTCQEVFNSARSFDKHRTGTYRPNTRKCLTIAEMVESGFSKNPKGWWGRGLENPSEEVVVTLPDEIEQASLLRVPNQLELALEKGGSRVLGDEAIDSQEEINEEATQEYLGCFGVLAGVEWR